MANFLQALELNLHEYGTHFFGMFVENPKITEMLWNVIVTILFGVMADTRIVCSVSEVRWSRLVDFLSLSMFKLSMSMNKLSVSVFVTV